MNAQKSASVIGPQGKRPKFWRSSIYEEPVWVSVAWIAGPVVFAAIAIYFVLT